MILDWRKTLTSMSVGIIGSSVMRKTVATATSAALTATADSPASLPATVGSGIGIILSTTEDTPMPYLLDAATYRLAALIRIALASRRNRALRRPVAAARRIA